MNVKEIKEKIIVGSYAFRGEEFSLAGEIMDTPKVLSSIENDATRNKIIRLAELTFNFLVGRNFRGNFMPFMRMDDVAGVNLITMINNCGIDYDARLYLLSSLVSSSNEDGSLEKILLDMSVILHFNLPEKEIRSYINLKCSLDSVDSDYRINDNQTLEEYLASILASSSFNHNLFTD